MTAITTPQRQERFRTIPCQNYFSFPEGFKPSQYRIKGYAQGERMNFKHHLTLDCFDSISFLRTSQNDKNGKSYIHALGTRIKEDSVTFLILEKV